MDDQAYGDRVRGGWRVVLSVALGHRGTGAGTEGRRRRRAVLVLLEPGELDVKDVVTRGDSGVVRRAARVVTLVCVRRAQLFHDEHEGEAEEERQRDRGPVQRVGRRPAARKSFDSPRRIVLGG